MDPEILHARGLMEQYIFGKFLRRLPPPVSDRTRIKIKDIVKRIEELLFKTSFTEDYMDLETLEYRFRALVILGIEHIEHVQGVPPPPLQNRSSAARMQNAGGVACPGVGIGLEHAAGEHARNSFNMDHDVLRARVWIQLHIFCLLLLEQNQLVNDAAKMMLMDTAKHLEDGLFKIFIAENYMNRETLKSRYRALVRRGLFSRRDTEAQEPVNLMRRRTTAVVRWRKDN